MLKKIILTLVLSLATTCSTAWAQFEKVQPDESDSTVTLGTSQKSTYKVGLQMQATGGDCTGVTGTIPVPADWPEQTVRLINEEISPGVRVSYRMLENSVKQMLISIPRLKHGQQAQAVITVEIEKFSTAAPKDTSNLKIPKSLTRTMGRYLGTSPYIESRHGDFRKKANEIIKDVEGDWQKVEAIYDWTRENIEYTSQKPTSAINAFRDGKGDFEDVTGVFIALCRSVKIPARTVWVPGSSHAEFYLEHEPKKGSWYPAQVAGTRAFGEMPTHDLIIQKGDNFRLPEKKNAVRFVPEQLTGKRFNGKPTVKFIRETGSN